MLFYGNDIRFQENREGPAQRCGGPAWRRSIRSSTLTPFIIKLWRDGRVANTAIDIALAVDLEGRRDVLGHWVGEGGEGPNVWLSVVTDLQARGVHDIFIACVDGLSGFKAAMQAIFLCTHIQRCLIHQLRYSVAYVT